MLEEKDFPASFSVAALTLLAKVPFMLILFLMAGITVDRGLVLVQVSFVTRFALHHDMPPSQRVHRAYVMVEGDRFPVTLTVAPFTFLPVSPFMLVVLLVA